MQTLILNGSIVQSLADDPLVMEAVEEAFRLAGLGQVQMPSKSYLTFPEFSGDLRTMPAYLPHLQASGVKVVNSHPLNPRAGLPTVMALIVLNDPVSGFPQAILSATALTALRTAAAGALAAKLLARTDAASAGFIGAGTQARYQFRFLKLVRPIRSIAVYDVDKSRAEQFCEQARADGIDANVAPTAKDAAAAPIVVTTTPGRGPVCAATAFLPGCHINAIGADAPGKQELPPEILIRAKVVVDHREQAIHSGEINIPIARGLFPPARIHAELGEIVAGQKPGRAGDKDITIFDSTGLAIQDIAVAKRVFDRALDKGLGTRVDFGVD